MPASTRMFGMPGPVWGLYFVALTVALPNPAPTSAQPLDAQPATVIAITDGDTIVLQLADGRHERTRLIGVDAPETKHPTRPVGCYGPEASDRTTELALGQQALVELGVQLRDRYGRLLAYIYIDGQMLNLRLAAEGYALPLTIPPNVRYAEQFVSAATAARDQKLFFEETNERAFR